MAQQKLQMPPVEQLRGRQLGRILIKMGRIRRPDVAEALEIQKQRGGPIGSILVDLGHITEEDLNLALAAQVGMEMVEVGTMDVPDEVIKMVTSQMANTYKLIPYDYDADQNCEGQSRQPHHRRLPHQPAGADSGSAFYQPDRRALAGPDAPTTQRHDRRL